MSERVNMIDNKAREEQLSFIIDDVIRENYVKGDELETRLKIDIYLDEIAKEIGSKTAEELRDYFYSQNFDKLSKLYEAVKDKPAPYKRGIDMKERELLQKICSNSNEPITIYNKQGQEFVYSVLKNFEFEKKHYALLVDLETRKQKYFCYEYDEKSKEEKLVPVKDEKLVELFSFLGL